MTHARPHLQTHARGKGHSAVAGVAYRLGLRLQDKRTGEWHDYRRRALGEEIVAAFTLAPAGAPAWATDPAVVWDAVEAAELRKDSQVAHDFRIPIPFGLTDADAEAMARAMAQHIVSDWHTVVSVGLHRDSPVDAMGLPKPPGKQGFHAHVYFPTRALAFDADAARDPDEDGQGGSDGWAFGEKLKAFSKRKAASVVIDQLNQQWAALANHHTLMVGGVPDFTHLSYKRLGLDRVPQLRLGPSATAMERKGMVTEKGEALRAQLARGSATHASAPDAASPGATPAMPIPPVPILSAVPAPLTAPAPVPVPAATPAPVPVSVSIDASVTAPALTAPEVDPPSPSDARACLESANPIVFRPPVSPLPNPTSLAGRFLAELEGEPELPQPTPEQRHRLVEWLQRIERALRRLAAVALHLMDLRDRRRRDDTARCTFLVEGDAARQRRAEARDAVTAWTETNLWKQRVNRLLSIERKPAELVALEGAVDVCNTELALFERGATDAAHRVAALDARIATVEADQAQTQEGLTRAVDALHGHEPLYGMVLLSVAEPEHVPRLTELLPVLPGAPADAQVTVTLRTPEPALVLRPLREKRPSV